MLRSRMIGIVLCCVVVLPVCLNGFSVWDPDYPQSAQPIEEIIKHAGYDFTTACAVHYTSIVCKQAIEELYKLYGHESSCFSKTIGLVAGLLAVETTESLQSGQCSQISCDEDVIKIYLPPYLRLALAKPGAISYAQPFFGIDADPDMLHVQVGLGNVVEENNWTTDLGLYEKNRAFVAYNVATRFGMHFLGAHVAYNLPTPKDMWHWYKERYIDSHDRCSTDT